MPQPTQATLEHRCGRPSSVVPERNTVTRSLTRLTLALGTPYLIALAFIAFWPTPVDAGLRGDLTRATAWFARHGLAAVNYSLIESGANVVLFIPLGLLVALHVRARLAWIAVAVGALTSCLIELGQLLFLAARFATLEDVAANTTGAALGALVGCVLRAILLVRERRRAAKHNDAFAHIPLRNTSGVVADSPTIGR
nr:VanZ family protein [Rathayibacter iranicus]